MRTGPNRGHPTPLQGLQALQAADAGFAESIQILGPIEAPVARIAGQFRWQILIKSPQSVVLHRFVDQVLAAHPHGTTRQRVRLAVDVDPMFLM